MAVPLKTPALVWNTAEELRVCLCNAFNEQGTCKCPCRSCVIVGTPAFDDCCNGQLTVSLERLYVHDDFPAPAQGPVFCAAPLAAEFLITYVRCAPVVKDDGSPPTCDELSKSALDLYSDMYMAYRSIICCLRVAKRHRKFVMHDGTIISPSGGCEGFELRLTIEIEDTLSD